MPSPPPRRPRGPAAQLTLSGLRLVDKLHSTNGGEYLELISTPQQRQLVSVLYRKVLRMDHIFIVSAYCVSA